MAYKDPEKQRQAQRESYLRTKEERYHRQKGRRKEFLDYLQKLKDVPCADCGNRYPPYVMEFDHLPGHDKLFGLANLSLIPSMAALQAEVAKCEIVCSNCHRVRTFTRRAEESGIGEMESLLIANE